MPVDLSETIVSSIYKFLRNQYEEQDNTGILVCLTCLSGLCGYGCSFRLWSNYIESEYKKVCTEDMIDLLAAIASAYPIDSCIQQQISIILMYCASIDRCIPRIIDTNILPRMCSFAKRMVNVIGESQVSVKTIDNAVYPYVSVIHHMCMQSIEYIQL